MTQLDADVLLAEDNASDAELILRSLGSDIADRVHTVQDGAEALDYLFCRGVYAHRSFERPPRLVVLDVKLPKVSGFEVLREVRRDPRTQPIPIVLLTSSNVERDVVLGYRLGANSYIQKPVAFDRFRETVRLVGRYWLTVNEPPPAATFAVTDA